MKRIAFVTDSTAYLTQAQLQEFGIRAVPLTVALDGQTYREGVDLQPAEFYRLLADSKALPNTSQPAPGAFIETFEALLQDHDTVMGLFLSSKLSGTVESARIAAAQVGGDIRIVDSGIASYGIAGPLLDSVELARRGGSPDDIESLWAAELRSMRAYFVVDTLDLLHRGGRIGGAAAVFGSLLQIKPILTVEDGRIELFEKIRTHRRAMERILGLFDEAAQTGKQLQVGVVHANRLADAEALKAQLCDAYPNIRADLSELGPVVGAHTGPGLLALLYYERVLDGDRGEI